MKMLSGILSLSMIIICCIMGYFFYTTHIRFSRIEKTLILLQEKIGTSLLEENIQENSNSISQDTSTTAASAQLWLKLQKNLQNTVVQLMVTNVEHNVLQPYKIPQPGQCSGSGFIISDDGEIVTNAHVVNGATSIMVQMPSFGKHQFEVEFIGIMPEKDFALLKFHPEDVQLIKTTLGKMPRLPLGDSDKVMRSQEIIALGYPLGQQSLKSTTGVISGRESGMIQMSAAINPGSSGGPSLDCCGKVIGINTAIVAGAQNVGYIIPINDLKIFLKDLRAGGLVRKPYIGVYQSMATKDLLQALGNPDPGGTYVVEVLNDSPLCDQLKPGDMIYEINGIPVDLYGEMEVPWSEDKVSTAEYITRLPVGHTISLVVYRKGVKKSFSCKLDRKKLLPIRQVFAEYEELPFEAFGGYVIMPLILNHLPLLLPVMPSLAKYAEDKMQGESVLIVTHVMPDSPAYRARLRIVGHVLEKVNGQEVKTLQDLRNALLKSQDVITIETSDHILIALSKDKVLKAERNLAQTFGYHMTLGMQQFMKKEEEKNKK
ncbi:MAG TPA: trypsin-like peptidase domain-containing protein [Candidatus Saccharimonadales bacterium]|nr:trypsin-like peptidase domain-containing protein [Candidatus Saccharimonadales bacterium]